MILLQLGASRGWRTGVCVSVRMWLAGETNSVLMFVRVVWWAESSVLGPSAPFHGLRVVTWCIGFRIAASLMAWAESSGMAASV